MKGDKYPDGVARTASEWLKLARREANGKGKEKGQRSALAELARSEVNGKGNEKGQSSALSIILSSDSNSDCS
ncbi:hypothetical protein RYX36_022255 [Vicia faba]